MKETDLTAKVLNRIETAGELTNKEMASLVFELATEMIANPHSDGVNIGGYKVLVRSDLEEKRAVRKGKKLRKAFERPRPDLPADAPENRTRKQIALTLPPDLIVEVNDYVEAEDMDRNRFIEAAIRTALAPRP
ncbi:MAG: hypothetical protein NT015_02950 [Alphaproteobacteria bacterium]|nr:hypothetical protein [Alphaproteobacteria bacterium]